MFHFYPSVSIEISKFPLFFVPGILVNDRKKDAGISQRTRQWLRNTTSENAYLKKMCYIDSFEKVTYF